MVARSSGQGLTRHWTDWPSSTAVTHRSHICAPTVEKHYGQYIFLAFVHDEQPNQQGLLLG